MRTLTERQRLDLSRASVELISVVTATLMRDRFSSAPLAQLLRLADRTAYLPETKKSDLFDRADNTDVGTVYTPGSGTGAGGTFAGLRLTNQRVRLSAPTNQDLRYEVFNQPVGLDQWARIVVPSFVPGAGKYIQAGVLLRAALPPTNDFYECGIGDDDNGTWRALFLAKKVAGSPVVAFYSEKLSAFSPGESLLAVAHGARVSLIHEPTGAVLVSSVDTSPLLHPYAGLHAYVSTAGSGAAGDVELDDFACGPYRQETLGLLLSSVHLGQRLGATIPTSSPATLDLLLTQLLAVLGRARFTDLLRHGLNQLGTYDLPLSEIVVEVLTSPTAIDRLRMGSFRVQEFTDATQESVRLACASRDAFLDLLLTGGTPVFPLNIGNWWTYTGGFDNGWQVELDCNEVLDTSEAITNDGTFLGPWSGFLLNDFRRCANGKVDRFYEKTEALYRDLDLLPGTSLRIDWTHAFSEVDTGSGFVPGGPFIVQVVVFQPPASQSELESFRSGLHGDGIAPTIARVLATETFAHLQPKGVRTYVIKGSDQFFGIILADPPEPGAGTDNTTYHQVNYVVSIQP